VFARVFSKRVTTGEGGGSGARHGAAKSSPTAQDSSWSDAGKWPSSRRAAILDTRDGSARRADCTSSEKAPWAPVAVRPHLGGSRLLCCRRVLAIAGAADYTAADRKPSTTLSQQ